MSMAAAAPGGGREGYGRVGSGPDRGARPPEGGGGTAAVGSGLGFWGVEGDTDTAGGEGRGEERVCGWLAIGWNRGEAFA